MKDAKVRLREEDHVFVGEAFVVPRDDRDLVARLEDAFRRLSSLDWRLHRLVITPRRAIERDEDLG